MQKIPTLFHRSEDHFVSDVVTPGCEWVLDGEGVATRKFDGVCVKVADGRLFTRQEARAGVPHPPAWRAAGPPDPITNKTPGWVPYAYSGHKKLIDEAVANIRVDGVLANSTYELVGPKVNRNPEGYEQHTLVRHGVQVLDNVDLSFMGLCHWLSAHPYEGIVWWRKPGDPAAGLAKLKRRDFLR